MTPRRKIAGLCAGAALLLALAPSALAAPAGDEYLPKVPQSGVHSSSGGTSASGGGSTAPTTTLPSGSSDAPSSTSASKDSKDSKAGRTGKKDDKTEQQIAPIGSSDSGDSGGGSGSILFNPIVLLMIAAVIAAAVGMTLLRRQGDGESTESPQSSRSGTDPGARREKGPRTPDGEIVTGPDRIA
jgi:hypothetical protein